MLAAIPFDLGVYLNKTFPSLSLDGGLLYRWPLSVRFRLGLNSFRERAHKLYESIFPTDDTCVVISQEWPEKETAATRYYPVFSLPGAFEPPQIGVRQLMEQTGAETGDSVLQWVQLPARAFSYQAIFEGIANADHARTPSVSSRVYFLNPGSDVLLHMYDDRGLDIIAVTKEPLIRISRQFPDWILDETGQQRRL
jgi:hypothetical protein